VARDKLAGPAYRVLLGDHCLGNLDDDFLLVGWIAAGEGFEGRCEGVLRREEHGHYWAYFEPFNVARGVS